MWVKPNSTRKLCWDIWRGLERPWKTKWPFLNATLTVLTTELKSGVLPLC